VTVPYFWTHESTKIHGFFLLLAMLQPLIKWLSEKDQNYQAHHLTNEDIYVTGRAVSLFMVPLCKMVCHAIRNQQLKLYN